MDLKYYPESPNDIPKNFTSLPSSYQFKAFLAILSIILFFLLYAALVTGLGYLAYYAIIYDMGSVNKLSILLKIGAIAGAVMLFVFTLKFIFKIKNHKRENRIKLNLKEHPELKAFVYKICKETGAPKPKSVYVDPDVNAYVSYTNMWLSLFFPAKKDLTLGLGLISCINLSEFKAVTAHEFGHFAQRSMKIGSYIISANTIIHDMIFTRDKWDDLLDQWRGADLRLSIAAWAITPVIWVIRQILNLFYQFLNIMYGLLSQEMEFNADKVAVSITGSDAIVSALWKLDDGSTCWNTTVNHAYLASQKNIYVDNLYIHNNLALERIDSKQTERLTALPTDQRGGKHFFASSEHSKVSMYASHPPNDHRENNAKIPYIAWKADTRSPWELLTSDVALQEDMTKLIYKQYLNLTPEEFSSEQVFEDFIKAESHGKDLLEDYDNTFENRFITIPVENTILSGVAAISSLDSSNIQNLKDSLKDLMQPVRDIETLMSKANQIAGGTTKEKSFSFKEKTYTKKSLQDGYMELFNAREKLFDEHFKQWDADFCTIYFALAKKAKKDKELLTLYKQHNALTKLYRSFLESKNSIYTELNNLQAKTEVTELQINAFGRIVNKKTDELNTEMNALYELSFVPLPNIDDLGELKNAIIEGGEFKPESERKMFEDGGFARVSQNLENAILHLQRIDQKSIAVILSMHKDLEAVLEDASESA